MGKVTQRQAAQTDALTEKASAAEEGKNGASMQKTEKTPLVGEGRK